MKEFKNPRLISYPHGEPFAPDEDSFAIEYTVFIVSEDPIEVEDYFIMKESFLDGTVKTQEQFDQAEWILKQAEEGDMPYIGRAENGRNNNKGIRGIYKVQGTLNTLE